VTDDGEGVLPPPFFEDKQSMEYNNSILYSAPVAEMGRTDRSERPSTSASWLQSDTDRSMQHNQKGKAKATAEGRTPTSRRKRRPSEVFQDEVDSLELRQDQEDEDYETPAAKSSKKRTSSASKSSTEKKKQKVRHAEPYNAFHECLPQEQRDRNGFLARIHAKWDGASETWLPSELLPERFSRVKNGVEVMERIAEPEDWPTALLELLAELAELTAEDAERALSAMECAMVTSTGQTGDTKPVQSVVKEAIQNVRDQARHDSASAGRKASASNPVRIGANSSPTVQFDDEAEGVPGPSMQRRSPTFAAKVEQALEFGDMHPTSTPLVEGEMRNAHDSWDTELQEEKDELREAELRKILAERELEYHMKRRELHRKLRERGMPLTTE
jgi:hypothetical protein